MLETTQPQVEETAHQPDTQIGTEQSEDAQAEAFLTVRYNKEALPLTREAAAEFAQKGLNYDKLNGRLAQASQKLEAYEGIEKLAREIAEHNGVSESEALEALVQRIGSEQQTQAAVNAQLDAFVQAYPDIDPCALPEAVLGAWKSGTPLCDAYAAYTHAAQSQAQARQTNAHNAAASMGGARGTGAAAPKPLSAESIAQMTPVELEKNHSRIWAYLTGQKQ